MHKVLVNKYKRPQLLTLTKHYRKQGFELTYRNRLGSFGETCLRLHRHGRRFKNVIRHGKLYVELQVTDGRDNMY